jgi:hypothetical protein
MNCCGKSKRRRQLNRKSSHKEVEFLLDHLDLGWRVAVDEHRRPVRSGSERHPERDRAIVREESLRANAIRPSITPIVRIAWANDMCYWMSF